MELESLKLEIIEWVCQLDDESILQKILDLKRKSEIAEIKNLE
jgi:hypothetical protein